MERFPIVFFSFIGLVSHSYTVAAFTIVSFVLMYILPTSEEWSESGFFSAVFAHLFTSQLKRSPNLLTTKDDLKASGVILILGQKDQRSRLESGSAWVSQCCLVLLLLLLLLLDFAADGQTALQWSVVNVSDIDECAATTTNDCDPITTMCENQIGTYTCSCKDGFYGPAGNRTCSGRYTDTCTTAKVQRLRC